MAESGSKLDLSLDDLIKQQAAKTKPARAGGKGGSKPGPASRLGVAKGRGGAVVKVLTRPAKPSPLLAAPGGGRGGARGGGGGPRIAASVITVRNPRSQQGPPRGGGFGPRPGGRQQLDTPPVGRWKHDLYNPNQAGPNRPSGGNGGGGSGRGGTVVKNKLFVSNLDHTVLDADLEELFSPLGPLKEAGVHYDRSGRSKGTAHVVFERPADALAAYEKYHNVALDGKRLNIELVETEMPRGTIAKLSSGIHVSTAAPDDGGGYAARNGGGGGGFGPSRPRSFVRGRGAPRSNVDAMQE